jgi:endo-1,4-beta-D-glucanase Y
MRRYIGYVVFFLGVVLIIFVLYRNSHYSTQTRIFSQYSVLSSSWELYKKDFINKDGRVIDKTQDSITTSEGQSYAMLRAVWIDDKQTFDFVWKWTQENLQKRQKDKLFGWKWGQLKNGSYGFLENGGNNSASDADSDIAFALILAGRRWQNPAYTQQARAILTDMWKTETAKAGNKRYLIAGNWAAQDKTRIIINPSYFSPYAWRMFAQVDKGHDWDGLITPAYELLHNAGTAPLNGQNGSGLPPDWVAANVIDGSLSATNIQNLKTDYSYDALRTPWRVALDYKWNNSEEAKQYLLKNFAILSKLYTSLGYIPGILSHSGDVIDTNENPAVYAAALGYFQLVDKKAADKIYQEKILSLYSNDENGFKKSIPYYEQNWLWFGTALYDNYLRSF